MLRLRYRWVCFWVGSWLTACAASAPTGSNAPPHARPLAPGQAMFRCQIESQCSEAALAQCGSRFEIISKARVASDAPRASVLHPQGTQWERETDRNRKIYTPKKPIPDLEMVVWCPASNDSQANPT